MLYTACQQCSGAGLQISLLSKHETDILTAVIATIALPLVLQTEALCDSTRMLPPPVTSLNIKLSNKKVVRIDIRTATAPAGFPYANSFQWARTMTLLQ